MTTENVLPNNGSVHAPKLAEDMLRGAAEIATFLYGDPEQRRTIYYYAAATRLPCFRIGSQLHARKSVLMKWIIDQERRGLPLSELDLDRG